MTFAPVDLRDIRVQLAEPGMPDPGVLQQPVMSGFTNRIGRLGGGHTAKFTLPPERMEPGGRKLVGLGQMAKEYGALFEYPQVDFDVGAPMRADGTPIKIVAPMPVAAPSRSPTPRPAMR